MHHYLGPKIGKTDRTLQPKTTQPRVNPEQEGQTEGIKLKPKPEENKTKKNKLKQNQPINQTPANLAGGKNNPYGWSNERYTAWQNAVNSPIQYTYMPQPQPQPVFVQPPPPPQPVLVPRAAPPPQPAKNNKIATETWNAVNILGHYLQIENVFREGGVPEYYAKYAKDTAYNYMSKRDRVVVQILNANGLQNIFQDKKINEKRFPEFIIKHVWNRKDKQVVIQNKEQLQFWLPYIIIQVLGIEKIKKEKKEKSETEEPIELPPFKEVSLTVEQISQVIHWTLTPDNEKIKISVLQKPETFAEKRKTVLDVWLKKEFQTRGKTPKIVSGLNKLMQNAYVSALRIQGHTRVRVQKTGAAVEQPMSAESMEALFSARPMAKTLASAHPMGRQFRRRDEEEEEEESEDEDEDSSIVSGSDE